ncbi:hypothetical protein PRIC2_004227 [Phytophthora ramorum]
MTTGLPAFSAVFVRGACSYGLLFEDEYTRCNRNRDIKVCPSYLAARVPPCDACRGFEATVASRGVSALRSPVGRLAIWYSR